MAKTLSRSFLILLFAAGAGFGAVAAAADDPGIHQVYEAANSGHLDQARNMMSQVLKDHPDSAKAHYVAAEIDARSGDLASARSEFQSAEKLAPGLPFAKPYAVQELRNQLYPQPLQQPRVATPVNAIAPIRAHSGFPWLGLIGIGFVVWIAWLIFRRRSQAAAPVYGGYNNGPAPGPGGYYGGGYPPAGGGPGLLGSLGTGLAVGAGVVAGEELAHRLLDGNGERVVERDVVYRDDPPQNQNADMGGSDFGIGDSGSWDDGGSSADIGGGDDWS
ncbi:MAG TPA: tetratricopeptide repeat protein [Nevskia sp.]|nr:tetratricopeptide repeat protein [Nevskia sp.]